MRAPCRMPTPMTNPFTALSWPLRFAACAVVLASGLADAESLTDGPYVLHLAAGSEARWICDGRVEQRAIVDRHVESVCGDVPALTLDASTAAGAPTACRPCRDGRRFPISTARRACSGSC